MFVHGLGSHRRGEKAVHFAERFNAQGWSFAAVDLRGHGDSDGTMHDLTMSGMLADLYSGLGWPAELSPRIPLLLNYRDHRLSDQKTFLFDVLWAWLQRGETDESHA